MYSVICMNSKIFNSLNLNEIMVQIVVYIVAMYVSDFLCKSFSSLLLHYDIVNKQHLSREVLVLQK